MTVSPLLTRCRICGLALHRSADGITWRHRERPADDHAPIPVRS